MSDLRDDIYQVAALLAELERILHPLALEEHGELMPAPALPPPLPPVTPRGAPPQGHGPGAPPRRSAVGAAPPAGVPQRSSAATSSTPEAARSVAAPRRAPAPPPTPRSTAPLAFDEASVTAAAARSTVAITGAAPSDVGPGVRAAAYAELVETPRATRVEPVAAPPIPRAPRAADASIATREADAPPASTATLAPRAPTPPAIVREPPQPAAAIVREPASSRDATAREPAERVAPPKLPRRAPRPAIRPVGEVPVRSEVHGETSPPTEAPPRLPGERHAPLAPHEHRRKRTRGRAREDVAHARRGARHRPLAPIGVRSADAPLVRPALPRRGRSVAPAVAPEPPRASFTIPEIDEVDEVGEVDEVLVDAPAAFWLRGGRLRVATDPGIGARTERLLPRFSRKLGRRL